MPTLVIATRESQLALWQTHHVKSLLEQAHPGIEVTLLPMTTQGDQILETPLYQAGGKGLFVKELEHALLDGRADLAVHSMKDVPAELPDGLGIHALLARADRRDAFVSNAYATLADLPTSAVVGTSSLRRQCLLKAQRPDLNIKVLRGNLNTRMRKLDEGQYDAIILACAGLDRLGWQDRIRERLTPEQFIPAPGQGIVGIECRNDDEQTLQLLAPLQDDLAALELSAERGFNARLGGGCHVPIAVRSELRGEQIFVEGLVGSLDGQQILKVSGQADRTEATQLGERLADELLAQGAAELLEVAVPESNLG